MGRAAHAADPPAPAASTPAGYIGSQECRQCHAKNYDRWSHDWHARALAPASPSSVKGSFAGSHFKGTSSEAWMKRAGPSYVMRTLDRMGKLGDFVVSWVMGG